VFANALAAAALAYTTFTGTPVEAPAEDTFSYTAASDDLGWTLRQAGIEPNHECVIHLSLRPLRSIVVRDTDPLCAAEASKLTVDVGQDGESYGQVAKVPQGGIELGDGSLADAAAITSNTCDPDTTCEGLEAPARWTPEYYGAGEGGELCSTDAACSAYTRDFGGEYGYGATPEKAVLWDGIPAL
jgi:hypothetical protein